MMAHPERWEMSPGLAGLLLLSNEFPFRLEATRPNQRALRAMPMTLFELPRMAPPPRTRQQRKQDALSRLEHDTDAWVATADEASGAPYLIPLSFRWDGSTLLVATPAASPTGRNLQASGKVRVGIGPTRDVVLIEGTAQALAASEIPDELGDAFAAKTGFDPRRLTSTYLYFRIHPQRLQAWREANERDLMRAGQWVVPDEGGPNEAPGAA